MSSKIDCYDFGGVVFGNSTKCPDSDTCCRDVEQCRPDRLCVDVTSPDVVVRGTCFNNPWAISTCAQICLYRAPTGKVPRVEICMDGSYCCDDDPFCCANRRGVFLNERGIITGFANQTTSATPLPPTSTPSASGTPIDSGSSDNIGLKIGIPVGVVAGVLLLVGLVLFLVRRSRRRRHPVPLDDFQFSPPQELSSHQAPQYREEYKKEAPSSQLASHEYVHEYVQELPSEHHQDPVELDTRPRMSPTS